MFDSIKDKIVGAVLPMGKGATDTFDENAVLHVPGVIVAGLPQSNSGKKYVAGASLAMIRKQAALPPAPTPLAGSTAPLAAFRLVCISDTHQRHRTLKSVPAGDVLVHAGDVLLCNRLFSPKASLEALADFNAWLGEQPHPVKIVIGGNHDHALQKLGAQAVRATLTNAVYLEYDFVSLPHPRFPDAAPLRVFGAPFSRGSSSNKAFQERQHKDQPFPEHRLPSQIFDPAITALPESGPLVDVFITHSSSLPQIALTGKAPLTSVHIGGHIHSHYGVRHIVGDGRPPYVSVVACTVDGNYKVANPPIVLDVIPHGSR
jgi:hypothetical protein